MRVTIRKICEKVRQRLQVQLALNSVGGGEVLPDEGNAAAIGVGRMPGGEDSDGARSAVHSGASGAQRGALGRISCVSGKGIRHLAKLDLGGDRRRGSRNRARFHDAGDRAWRLCRDHRAEPARALLVDGGRRDVRRGAGAVVSGRGRRGDGLCPRPLRRAVRGLRRSGAGRQGSGDTGPAARHPANPLSRQARDAEIRPFRDECAGRYRRRGPCRASAFRRGTRQAHRGADLRPYLRDALHLGHDGKAQGRGSVEPQHHRDLEEFGRVRSPAAERRSSCLSADGLGR